jgi:hypothetical protein
MGIIGNHTARCFIWVAGILALLLGRHDATDVGALVRRFRDVAATQASEDHAVYQLGGTLALKFVARDPRELSAAYRALEVEEQRIRFMERDDRTQSAMWLLIEGAQGYLVCEMARCQTREAADTLVGIITDPRVHHDGGKSLDLYDALTGCGQHGIDAIDAFGPSRPNARFLAEARADLLRMRGEQSDSPR